MDIIVNANLKYFLDWLWLVVADRPRRTVLKNGWRYTIHADYFSPTDEETRGDVYYPYYVFNASEPPTDGEVRDPSTSVLDDDAIARDIFSSPFGRLEIRPVSESRLQVVFEIASPGVEPEFDYLSDEIRRVWPCEPPTVATNPLPAAPTPSPAPTQTRFAAVPSAGDTRPERSVLGTKTTEGEPSRPGSPVKPAPAAPLDEWFDYYHLCKDHGFKCTLKDIAEATRYAEGYVRQQHMLYKAEREEKRSNKRPNKSNNKA